MARRIIRRHIPKPPKLRPKLKVKPPSANDLVVMGMDSAREYAREATGSAQASDYTPYVVALELQAAYVAGIRKGLELSRALWL